MNMLPVVFENKEIIIINKKSGLAVQGGTGIRFSADEMLSEQMGYKVYPVHRLDKDTAGLLLFAKTSAAAGVWTKRIASGAIGKEYAALCIGVPADKSGTFTASIGVKGDEKTAVTNYIVKNSAEVMLPLDSHSVCECKPLTVSFLHLTLGTGRMHQIRIHLQQADCPIIADDKYGDFKLNKVLRSCSGIKKLQLAAVKLTVPIDGKKQIFEIPLPEHMQVACRVLFDNIAT